MNVVYLKDRDGKRIKPREAKERLKYKEPPKSKTPQILYRLAYVGAGALAITFSPLIAVWAMLARYGCEHTWLPSTGDKIRCLHCNKRTTNTVLLGTERL